MPIYEYDCPKCGVIEVMQSINEDRLVKCPDCRRKIKRLISLNNFHLKGTGWYATDYANKSEKPNGKGAEKESGKEAGSSESKKSAESKSGKKEKSKTTSTTSTTSDG